MVIISKYVLFVNKGMNFMRKLFFTFCFISSFIIACPVFSAVRSITTPLDVDKIKQDKEKYEVQRGQVKDPVFETEEEVKEYIRERLQKTVTSEIPPEEFENTGAIDIQPSDEEIEMMNEEKKPFFQKVYESAIARTANKPQQINEHPDINYDEEEKIIDTQEQQRQWAEPDYQTVNVTLPSGRKILVPAIEHIPYMMSDIEILPTGVIKISEKVIVVANGVKLKNGLTKALPKFSTSRAGEKVRLDINISSVRINGQEFEYKIEELGKYIMLSPKQKHFLEPGVYTYEFEYIVDRQLWDYGDFRELFWNLTGSSWNLIIARAGAILRTPGNEPELGKAAFINNHGNLDLSSVSVSRIDNNTLTFVTNRPIFIGESMQIIVSIPSKNFIAVDIDKKIYWAIDDYGDIILSLLGLIAIVGGYFVSWIFITENKSKQKFSMQRNAPILRYLIKGGFDKISFGAFLLDLYKRRIIDIRKENEKLSLIKLTDNLTSLSSDEKQAVNNMFINHESVLTIEKANILKLNRAFSMIEKDTKEKISKFLLKINSGYIFFSTTMFLLAQLGIAMLGYSPIINMSIMLGCDIVLVLSIAVFRKNFGNKILAYISKIAAVIMILISIVVLNSILSLFAAVLTAITIYIIFAYTNMFSNRNGLIKINIKEAKATRDYIIKNVDVVSMQRNFISQQANIFALELDNIFKDKVGNSDFYKIDIISEMIKF